MVPNNPPTWVEVHVTPWPVEVMLASAKLAVRCRKSSCGFPADLSKCQSYSISFQLPAVFFHELD